MTTGEVMIWAGAVVTLLGVAGLFACVVYGLRLRGRGLPEAEFRAGLKRGVLWNTAALFVSVTGLMLVILGITFR